MLQHTIGPAHRRLPPEVAGALRGALRRAHGEADAASNSSNTITTNSTNMYILHKFISNSCYNRYLFTIIALSYYSIYLLHMPAT